MTSNEWLTLQEAVARATMRGMSHEAADIGIPSAIDNQIIQTRTVFGDPLTRIGGKLEYIGVHEVCEINGSSLDAWVNRINGMEKKNKGGAPPKYDWAIFYFEIIRRANTPDGLPKKQVELINQMLLWASNSGFGDPGVSTVSDKISKLLKYLEKNR